MNQGYLSVMEKTPRSDGKEGPLLQASPAVHTALGIKRQLYVPLPMDIPDLCVYKPRWGVFMNFYGLCASTGRDTLFGQL